MTRRSDPAGPGYTRRRHGRGFTYLDGDGRRLSDAATIKRIKSLVIPPAWEQVWISPDPRGHIQATGVDAAGRKQYLYHPDWRAARDAEKFDHVLDAARRLPEVRDRLRADLAGRGLTRTRVLAAIVLLLDQGMFRIGGDEYAARDDNPSYGLSTLKPSHVRARRGCVVIEFPGKSGVAQTCTIDDADLRAVLLALKRRRRTEPRLFAHWNRRARRWQEVHADEINAYLREISAGELTAKDLRTWHGTVAAAAALARIGPQPTRAGRRRAVAEAMRETADLLGNTPAVARSAYVDPRVTDHYDKGEVITGDDEREVRDLLGE